MTKTTLNKTIYAYVPISMGDLNQLLSGTGLSPDRARLLFHNLHLSALRQASRDDKRGRWLLQQGWVSIDSKILKRILTSNYVKYLDWAEAQGFIERRRNEETGRAKYTAGKYCQVIKIASDLLHKDGTLRHFRKEAITEKKALAAISRLRQYYKERREASGWYHLVNPTHIKIVAMTQTLKFRMDDAEKFLTKKYNYAKTTIRKNLLQYYLHIIEAIDNNTLDYFTVDRFGNRLHTPITGLYSPLRSYIYFESMPDEPISYVDIGSSQVYLLSSILARPDLVTKLLPEFAACIPALEKYSHSPDVLDFHSKCCEGIIYEHFAGAYNKQKPIGAEQQRKMRDKVKKRLISFLYSNPKNAKSSVQNSRRLSEFKDFFLQHYPNVYRGINELKAMGVKEFPFMEDFYKAKNKKYGDHAGYINPSRVGQLLESLIILGLISPELIQRGILFTTVHDAFITPKCYAEKIKETINEKFCGLGLTPPKIKITEL